MCTGNICRSPAAELLMRNLLVGRLGGARRRACRPPARASPPS
ncbi:hypothetical protein [Pseudonocardia sp. McavD-2-B]